MLASCGFMYIAEVGVHLGPLRSELWQKGYKRRGPECEPLLNVSSWLSRDCWKVASLSSESRSVALQLLLLSEVCLISANEGEINSLSLSDGQQLKEETTSAWPWLTETHVNILLPVPSSSSISSPASPHPLQFPQHSSFSITSSSLSSYFCHLHSFHLCPFQIYHQFYLPPPPRPPHPPPYVSEAEFLSDADS